MNTNENAACWIWPGSPSSDLINVWAQFRRPFELKQVPERCEISITADKAYRLFVNKEWVLDGPGRGFAENWFYDRVDIAPYLKKGKNVIAVLAHNPGIGSHQYIHAGFAGFILEGEADGIVLNTSTEWARRLAPDIIRQQTRLSEQLGWQEFVDARLGDGDWRLAEYDDRHWGPPSFWGTRVAGSPPWHNLQERDIPLLRTEMLTPTQLTGQGRNVVNRDWRGDRNIATAFRSDMSTLHPMNESMETLQVEPQDENEVQFFVFTLGREVFASTIFDVNDAQGGEVIDMLLSEGLENGQPAIDELAGCQIAMAHRYTCTPGAQRHETFSPLGGCYLGIAVRGKTAGFQLRLQMRHREYPFDVKGAIEAPGTRFEEIYNLCVHTQQLCASDTYVDCPGREQAMWWGDVVTHFGTSALFAADDRLLVRGIRLIAHQRLPNGLTYSHAPTKAHEAVLPDFTLAWIRSFWMLYRFSGSADLAREYGDEIMRAFSYFFEQSESTGLLPTDPRYWLFLDWAETFKDGTSTLYNLEYLETLENAQELFEAAELVDFAQEVQMRAGALRQTILEKLWNTQAGEPFDGLDRKGEPVPRSTLHTLVRSILLNIHPEEHRRWADEYLLPFIAGERPVGAELYADVKRDVDLGVLTPYFLHFTFLALEKLGEDEAILSCIQRWWGNMIDRGLSTTEEVWDAVPGIASTCHAWAAHPLQHITRSLLGIRPTAPGWKEILFKPGSIATAVRGTVDTPLGPIRVELDESGEHGRLELPAGIHAKIEGVSRTGKPYHFIPLGPSGSLEYAVH